jgi:hypothetical protein
MDRVYNIMHDTGVYLSWDTDLRHLLYLSNKVEQERVNRKNNASNQTPRT